MRISDWSSDVCSSDLFSSAPASARATVSTTIKLGSIPPELKKSSSAMRLIVSMTSAAVSRSWSGGKRSARKIGAPSSDTPWYWAQPLNRLTIWLRSEEHTSELQSLMRISYAVFCLKKKKKTRKLYTRRYQQETE